MRKIVIAVALALSLAACGTQSVLTGGTSFTASVQNPVTVTMLYEAEQGLTVVAAGLVAYRKLCIAKSIPQSCRGVITKLQVYTRQAVPLLKNLRSFVRNNDQVNAIVVYNQFRALVSDMKAVAQANGVL